MGLSEQPLNLHTLTVTIANGQSLSDAADLKGLPLVGVILPAGYDTADLSFQGSMDGSTFANIYGRDGTELSLTGAAASRYYLLPPSVVPGFRHVKVRSGLAASPVSQTGDAIITLVVRLVT